MKILTLSLLATFVIAGCESSSEAAPATVASGSLVEGAWTAVEIVDSDPTVAPLTNPASVYLFAGNHYSVMHVQGEQPRPQPASPLLTDAEKVIAFNTFIANSGTFEIDANAITTHPTVAKNPAFMGGGGTRFEYRFAGDTLILTENATDLFFVINGARTPWPGTQSVITYKLVRSR
jgi:hypothetical protein